MEKEFIPYEQALELKELGFDEECLGYYSFSEKVTLKSCFNRTPIILSGKKCSIPLYSQVFRWFREKYNLESHVKKDWTDGILQGYESIIECLDGYIDVGTFKTYEEAELECLKKLIEIVKEDK